MKNKYAAVATVVALILAIIGGCSAPANNSPVSSQVAPATTVLTFLHFNDTYTYGPNANGMGGFAPLKTLLDREIKRVGGPTLITFGGDAISPTALGGVTRGTHDRIPEFGRGSRGGAR